MDVVRKIAAPVLQFAAVAYLTVIASLLFWSHAPRLVGWDPRVVLTGSMTPVIQPGDVSVIGPATVGPATLPRGRVVLVRAPQMSTGYYLHRLVRYDADGRLVTRGDANPSNDSVPVSPEAVRGQLRLLVPVVGRPVVWLGDGNYVALVLVGAATWLSLLGVTRPNRVRARPGGAGPP
jgi:signal peptidase